MVRYTYDHKRRVTAVELNGVENYVTYAYEDVTVDGKKAEKVTATMKDDSTSVVIKDLHGNTLSTILGGKTVNYTYDNKNRLTAISGRSDDSREEFTFDALDNLSGYVYNDGSNTVSESYTYNANRQLASKTVDGKTYTYAYKDDTAKSLESVSVDSFTFVPNTDALGRNRGKTITVSNNKIAEEQITYLKFGDHATNIPATVYYGDKKNGSYAFSDHFKYKYDSMGNITEIRENGELYAKYTYDTIGRLVREDNKKRGKTVTFTYDANGNILCRKEYAFTLTDNLDELASNNFAYTYDGDKLLSYNGKVCEYDIVGNPTKYRDKTATWANGRQLTSFDGNTFTYDNLGRRTGKNDVSFTYDASGNLIRQSNGISFIYDASGVCGLTYSDATYFYRKDILGNIVALLDANGEIVAKYTYDAWGKCQTTVVNSNAVEIANLNPFRYRGYYYDVETELYFLKTRYYDLETGRFITIDDISYLDPDSINGLNLYAYCRNNPVMYFDSLGKLPLPLEIITSTLGYLADLYAFCLKQSLKYMPELTMASAKKIARAAGHIQSARSYIRARHNNIITTQNLSKSAKNFSKNFGKAVLVVDILWSVGENYFSGDPNWISDSVVDIGISVAIYALGSIPYVGWALAIGATILAEVFDDKIEAFKDWFATEWNNLLNTPQTT